MARKPTEFVQFKLRIREALRKAIEREAQKKNHSANSEAVERLERSFNETFATRAAIQRMQAAEQRVEDLGDHLETLKRVRPKRRFGKPVRERKLR